MLEDTWREKERERDIERERRDDREIGSVRASERKKERKKANCSFVVIKGNASYRRSYRVFQKNCIFPNTLALGRPLNSRLLLLAGHFAATNGSQLPARAGVETQY